MVKRSIPHRSAPSRPSRASVADAQEALRALGPLGEGLGKLLEGAADLAEAGSSSKVGEFSIGGPERKSKVAYHMQFGTLEAAMARRQGTSIRAKTSVKPFFAEPEIAPDTLAPSLIETASGAMIVAEVGSSTQDQVRVSVDESGSHAIIAIADNSATIVFSKSVDPNSLSVSQLNAIMTANFVWKD